MLGGTEEVHKEPQDNWSVPRDLNPGPPEYEAGVLTTQPVIYLGVAVVYKTLSRKGRYQLGDLCVKG
jgi:hypothetical protein